MTKINYILKTIQDKYSGILICKGAREMANILGIKETELHGVRQSLSRVGRKKYIKKINHLSNEFIYLSFVFDKKRYKGIVHKSFLNLK